jgi:hypothetical protein
MMGNGPFRLSKSKVMSGRQCAKRLWLETHRRDLMETSSASRMAFENGHRFGETARSAMGTGRLVEHVHNIGLAIEETTQLLKTEQRLFEPAFVHDGVVARADALERFSGGWHMIEVKASTSVKDIYLDDCAVQSWVAIGAGAPVEKVSLAFVDRSFVYQGDGDYARLMKREDVSDRVFERMQHVATWVTDLREALNGDEPALRVGAHCKVPYECPFSGYCQSQEPPPPEHPVELLPDSGALVARMAARDITDLRMVPEAELVNKVHRRMREAHVSGKPVLDAGADEKLKALGWPRYYLDFETVMSSVPVWTGTRPYQQVPFQWSCHVQDESGALSHMEFLDTSGESPIERFASSLLEAVGTTGPVFIYNQSFEASGIREIADMLPEKRQQLLSIVERLVDLFPITTNHYYHPDMRGSFSIKDVLPTIAPDLDYATPEHVQDGGMAQQAWREIGDAATPDERKASLRQGLLDYCKRDTLALVRLADFLRQEHTPINWFENGSSIKEVPLFEALEKTAERKIRLPLYQRDAVWSEGRICALWDSLLRGFPLPSFLLVHGSGQSRSLASAQARREQIDKSIGDYFDLLDGQQRLTAIVRGVTPAENPAIRLWLDLAPPEPNKKKHPFKFKYWIHPCTNVFPFGFRMDAAGEHDFAPLPDEQIRSIWDALQRQDDPERAGKDFHEIPLAQSFPWHAKCPVPLDEAIALLRADDAAPDSAALKDRIKRLAEQTRDRIAGYKQEWTQPDENVLESVAAGLLRLRKATLAFQLIDLESISDNDDDGYTLFERIGRGGVQISQRQLAVSNLMQTIGPEGNDAVAGFQQTRWGHMLDTEDILHALARIAYVSAEVKPAPVMDAPDFDKKLQEWDMFDLSIERLKTMKKDPELWHGFASSLRPLVTSARLKEAFDFVFGKVLQFDPEVNPNGFALVQLAQTGRSREGIVPVTLHPILLRYFKHGIDSSFDSDAAEDMLRWVIFMNGLTKDAKNDRINRLAFWQAFNTGRLDFPSIRDRVFGDDRLRGDLGFVVNEARLGRDGNVFYAEVKYEKIPEPHKRIELSARRLVLQNWASQGVSKFVLMWNQRAPLQAIYGDVDTTHLPALFGKGRPFDLDHIVARNRFLYSAVGVDSASILTGTEFLFKEKGLRKKTELHEGVFRKSLPDTSANFRYWPKHLNRADKDALVRDKMAIDSVRNKSADHPLSRKLDGVQCDTPWDWSVVPLEDKLDWESLPPDDYRWNADLVARFIRVLLRRQYQLYGSVYQFLTPGYRLEANFNPDGIIEMDQGAASGS